MGWTSHGRHVRVGILAADGQAGIAYKWSSVEAAIEMPRHDAHVSKLRLMIGRCDCWMGLPLLLHSADDHHAFHEDAKPGDLTGQLGTRWRSSSSQFTTTWMTGSVPVSI